MMLASLLARLGFSNSGVTMTHNITYPVGAKTHAAHGVLLSPLLPAVLEYNLPVQMERVSKVASLMGEEVDSLPLMELPEGGLRPSKI
jgi:alcohol dehydrogenase class IV